MMRTALACFLALLFTGQAFAQTTSGLGYIPTQLTLAQITAAMPPANWPYGQLVLSTDNALIYNTGSAWVPVYMRYSVVTATIPATGLGLLGACTTPVTVSNSAWNNTAMAIDATPQVYQGDNIRVVAYWQNQTTVAVKLCALVAAVTSASTAVNVKVLP